jgi:hypothetical protein
MNFFYRFKLILFFIISITYIGCGSSKEISKHEKYDKESSEEKNLSRSKQEQLGMMILEQARIEQQNPMYSKEKDSTILYWLNNALILLNNHTKCNIYALNTIYKAGFKCPDVNVITHDLMDTLRFNEFIPYISGNDPDEIIKGDLIVWHGHVIIFDKLVKLSNRIFAQAWWAGTRQADNGENIINNVIYGKYPLEGYYIVRRPVISSR